MKLWNKASGTLKDRNSIWIASLSNRSSYRNPDMEAAVIKSTSHDESYVDYRNAQRVFSWVRTSPAYLKPLIWALSRRMEKTRSWVVALKGLMLMHGIFCCKIPVMEKIGRLPFDLSNFSDGHSHLSKTWCFNSFIRSYFAFLDQKAFLLGMESKERDEQSQKTNQPVVEELVKLQQWQTLLDMLLQIKPESVEMKVSLILEAMDCIIIEIFDIYSKICNGVARILVKICTAGKVEAHMALKVLRRATVQGDQLSLFFELCKNLGVLNASEFPKVEHIPEEDIVELEHIIHGVLQDMAVVMKPEGGIDGDKDQNRPLKTVISNEWEVFDEQLQNDTQLIEASHGGSTTFPENPSTDLCISRPHAHQNLPDLISFV